MKWLRLTTKECDMLDTIIGEWLTQKERRHDDIIPTIHSNTFTPKETSALWQKVQIAYWDKENPK